MFNWLQIAAGAALGAIVAAGPLYMLGRGDGRQAAAVAALEQSVRTLRERNDINDKVSAADAAALCGDLGLSGDDEAECVRRLREADSQP